MDTIDVRDLPEPMARAIAQTVEHLRAELKRHPDDAAPQKEVSWPLGVKGTLRREELYEHLDE